MENIPLEIWFKIFELACTDGGYTGTSLALVSKSFCEASKHAQLQAVCLSGYRRLRSFDALLVGRAPPGRRVHHLFISLLDIPDFQSVEAASPRSSYSGAKSALEPSWEAHIHQLWQTRIYTWWRTVGVTLPRSLEAVAPSLRSLTLAFGFSMYSKPLSIKLSFCLPLLEELVFSGPYDLFAHTPCRAFPSLKTLHLLYYNPNLDMQFVEAIECLRSRAPSMTHLRITGLTWSYVFPAWLRAALDIGPPAEFLKHVKRILLRMSPSDPGTPYTIVPLPPCLQRIVIEHRPNRPRDDGLRSLQYDRMIQELRDVIAQDSSGRVVCVDEEDSTGVDPSTQALIERMKEDWLGRVGGRSQNPIGFQ